jgi:SPP1 gp7 family putative phage head morphogenesis protein
MPVQLWPIPGYWIFRTPYNGAPFFQINWGTWVADLPERDVIWLKDLDPENPYWRGAGVGESLGDEIEIDEYAGKTQKALFYNHGVPAAIISLRGATQTELDRAKENFNQTYGGFWNAAKMFWTGTEMDVKQLALDFVDSNIGQLRKDERDKIIQMWGVPPEIMGINENSNRATIAEAKSIYAERVLLPRLEFLRVSYQNRLVPEFDDRIILDYVDPSPDDQAFKLQVASAAPWSRSKNEWRELGGLSPVDGGDDVFPPMPVAPPPPPSKETTQPGPGQPPMPKSFVIPLARAEEEDDTLREGAVDDVVGAFRDEDVTAPMEALYSDELKKWMAKVADETGLDVDFALVNPKIAEYMRQRSLDKVKGLGKVNDTTRDQLRESLGDGIDAGEGIRELSARVRNVFEDAQGYRATNIARTETTRAAGWGNLAAFKAGGAEAKEWVATRDSRTRDDHADMDGQVAGIDEPFETPGGIEGDHPGDFDDPQEDCGCRCTMSVADKSEIDSDDEKAMRSKRKKTLERRDAAWKFYDAAVTPWEQKARTALVKAFGRQRAAVLAALQKARA